MQQLRVVSVCPYCRFSVYPGSRQCGNCGRRLEWNQQQPPTNAAWCPNCRAVVKQNSNFCTSCGIKLNWSQQQTAKTELVEKPARKTFSKIISGSAITVLAVVVVFLAFIYISPDYDMYMVKSESMVPVINMGDIVVTGPVSKLSNSTISPGTIVTYSLGENLITHRVLSSNGDTLVTKGDAVEDADPRVVSMTQVRGIYLFKIPWLGFVANFIRGKLGWFLIIIVPAVLLLGLIFWGIAKEAIKINRRRTQTQKVIINT